MTTQPSIGSRITPYSLFFILIVEYLVFAAFRPDLFFSGNAINIILSSQAPLMIVSLAVTLTLIVGEFDMTIGTNFIFANVLVAALTANMHLPLALAVVIALVASTLVGLINALLVVHLGINSFIATLGISTLLVGVTFWAAGSTIISSIPPELKLFAASRLFGLPLSVYYAFAIALILWFVYRFRPAGRQLYFVGSNEQVARLAGVRTKRLKTGAFVVSGFIIGFAGLLQAGTVGSADPTAGMTFTLPAFAAAFLGTTAIQIGKFNIWGAVVGSLLLFTGITGLSLLGFTGWVQDLFNGFALTIALIASRLTRKA